MRSSFSSSPAEPISRFVWRGLRMPRHKCSPEFQRDALLRGGDSNRSYHPTASGWHWLCWTESRVISGPCPRRQDSCGSSPTSARNRYSSRDASPGPRTIPRNLCLRRRGRQRRRIARRSPTVAVHVMPSREGSRVSTPKGACAQSASAQLSSKPARSTAPCAKRSKHSSNTPGLVEHRE